MSKRRTAKIESADQLELQLKNRSDRFSTSRATNCVSNVVVLEPRARLASADKQALDRILGLANNLPRQLD